MHFSMTRIARHQQRPGAMAWISLFGAACVLATAVGCAKQNEPAEVVEVPATPEGRFEDLVVAIKRQFSIAPNSTSTSSGAVDPGTPVVSSSTKIDHEFIAPEGEGASPKGVVTIHSQYSTTVVLPITEKEEEGTDAAAKEAATDPERLADLSLAKDDPLRRLGASPIQTIESETVTKIEFEFRDGEWVLVSEIDEQNEPFTASAVRYALRQQVKANP